MRTTATRPHAPSTSQPAGRGTRRALARRRALRRALKRRAASWRRRAAKSVAVFMLAMSMGELPSAAFGQMGGQLGGMMGQSAMAPAGGGLVNRAVVGLQELNANGPGYSYFGFNGADRGLGYIGSYMTVGAFVPYAQDDLGGFWSADLRTHLSVNGGFFSNVGAVRKQFVGGGLLGIGVYWDYDGDVNQYGSNGAAGTERFGQFGHAYNQVGVSSELLTDWGNIRSNGYIPVGRTAYTAGAPGSPFYQNYVMCQYGLDAALAGADLEVGAYVPGLTDWAGMVSVGGYALGNANNNWNIGPQSGDDVVPWFGGVYTRLDMTFLENWDFSLQANNDSYFDWTGFARLTYRMGGSRRRNVPDQMEQPMMRNEHIVRAHQTPLVAYNPGNVEDGVFRPWNVIHVDNSAPDGGNGTATKPFNTLADGNAAATNPWDIVFVSRGDGTAVGYDTPFSFNAPNQYLVGDGATFSILTSPCGYKNIATNSGGQLPLLSNPAGPSVYIDGDVAGGATVANFQITGSDVGIYATGDLTSPAPASRPTLVQNVAISGNGTSAGQSGVEIVDASGEINFVDTQITDMTRVGLGVYGGNPTVNYQGSITNDTSTNGGVASPLIEINGTDGADVNLALGSSPGNASVVNQIYDKGGEGIRIANNSSATTIDIDNITLMDNVGAAIGILDDSSTTLITAGTGDGISKSTAGAAITVEGGSPDFEYFGPIINSPSAGLLASSFLLNVSDVSNGFVTVTSPPGSPFIDSGDGIQIVNNSATDVLVSGAVITSRGAQGVLINDHGGTVQLLDTTINAAENAGILATDSPFLSLELANVNIALAGANAIGLQADDVGAISSTDSNSITTASSSQPAVQINDTPSLNLLFNTVSSGVNPGTNAAMEFLGGTSGTFTVTSAFTVGGVPGTEAADVNNSAGITVQLPPP